MIYAQISSYLAPNSDSSYYLLGRIFKSINNNERALKYFKKVNEYSLVTHDANIAYAETIYDLKGLDSSTQFLNNIKQSFPDNINYLIKTPLDFDHSLIFSKI